LTESNQTPLIDSTDEGANVSVSQIKSPWCLWKWSTVLSQMALLYEVIVTIVYWTVIHGMAWELKSKMGKLVPFIMIANHTVPIFLVLIEFCLNSLVYEISFLYVAELPVIIIYGIINLILTKVKGKPVYPVMSWDSVESVLFAVGILPILILIAYLLRSLSNYKHSKYGHSDVDK